MDTFPRIGEYAKLPPSRPAVLPTRNAYSPRAGDLPCKPSMTSATAHKRTRSSALIAVLWLIVAGYAVFIGWKHFEGNARASRGERPLYTDYTPTYAASLLVREQPPANLYDPRRMTEAGRQAAHAMYDGINEEQARKVGFAPWMYPPTFILLIAPLAYLPYLLSWIVWLAATGLPYLAAIRQILPGRLAWPFALAAPPAFFNAMYGQTGFLTAGLIGLGLTQLRQHPVRAGVLIGLASVKPHFGVLIPLAFAAGGHWRAFGAAAATVIATIVASVIAFGDEPWLAFIGTALFHLEGFSAGAFNFLPMTTVLSTVHLAGLPLDSAWSAQYATAALMAALVIHAWWRGRRRPDTTGLQAAILCLATLLAIPMAYLYDLVLVVPAAAWIWADMQARGAPDASRLALVVLLAALLAAKTIAAAFAIQIAAPVVAILLALALRRYYSALLYRERTHGSDTAAAQLA